jgi:hypothetical protein
MVKQVSCSGARCDAKRFASDHPINPPDLVAQTGKRSADDRKHRNQ